MKLVAYLALGLLASLVMMAIVIALVPSLDDFDPSNPLWNGLSVFTISHSVTLTPAIATSGLSSGTVLVIGATLNFTSSEVEAIRGFVERGGYLVVLEDFTPTGYTLIKALGFNIEVYNGTLVDPLYYYKDYTLPRVTLWNTTGYFNYGVAVKEHDGRCVGYSTAFSFADLNSNKVYDSGEPRGPLCVAVEWRLGRGSVLLVADSSIPINSMLEVNRELLKTLTRGDVHLVSDKWSKGLYSTVRSQVINLYNLAVNTQLRYILAIALIATYPLILRILRAFREEAVDELEEDIRRVKALHPNWDLETLKTIARELHRRRRIPKQEERDMKADI